MFDLLQDTTSIMQNINDNVLFIKFVKFLFYIKFISVSINILRILLKNFKIIIIKLKVLNSNINLSSFFLK